MWSTPGQRNERRGKKFSIPWLSDGALCGSQDKATSQAYSAFAIGEGTGDHEKSCVEAGRLDASHLCLELAPALRELLQRADCFTWVGAYGVIRVYLGATNHALLVNDVSRRHRQAESVLAVKLVQLAPELQINRFEVIGKHEYETKLTRYLQPAIAQHVETEIEATMDRVSVLLQLRRYCYQAGS